VAVQRNNGYISGDRPDARGLRTSDLRRFEKPSHKARKSGLSETSAANLRI
jgi:hypothetical protein